jgi:hypothetical protein
VGGDDLLKQRLNWTLSRHCDLTTTTTTSILEDPAIHHSYQNTVFYLEDFDAIYYTKMSGTATAVPIPVQNNQEGCRYIKED